MKKGVRLGVLLLVLACRQSEDSSSLTISSVDANSEREGGTQEARLESVGAPGPTRLLASDGCIQPEALPQCESGYCRVKAGCFIQGAPRDEPGRGRFSNVQVEVRLTRDFLMGQTEVTRAQWLQGPWGMPERKVEVGDGVCSAPECPISNVSFFDALEYANWLSEQSALPKCYELTDCTGKVGLDYRCAGVGWTSDIGYNCAGYRLPMEAEWEYATRAGTTTAFHGGEAISTRLAECVQEPALEPIGWYCYNSDGRAHPVAQKNPNGWGLHDLHGNLLEWCNDLRDGDGYGQGPLVDPPGTLTPGKDLLPTPTSPTGVQTARVLRGGNFVTSGDSCTAANRLAGGSYRGSTSVGFRLARTVRPKTNAL